MSAECIQFLCPLHDSFYKAIPFSLSWERSPSPAPSQGLSGRLSAVLPALGDPSSAAPSAAPLSISPTSSRTTGVAFMCSGHVTSYFLQHRPHLLIKLLALPALPKEVFCKIQVFILGSNVCRSPFVQVFFSQTLTC